MSEAEGTYKPVEKCVTVVEFVPLTPEEAAEQEEFSSGVPSYDSGVDWTEYGGAIPPQSNLPATILTSGPPSFNNPPGWLPTGVSDVPLPGAFVFMAFGVAAAFLYRRLVVKAK